MIKDSSLVLAPACSPLPAYAAKDKLHLYNWNNYIAPETVKRFEESCKCEVVQTYYSDNEELLAKLAAGAKGYDVLVPTGNAVEALIKGKQLRPLDKAELPNIKNVEPQYLDTKFDPGNKYSAPYAMSTTIIGYNDEKMKELGLPTDTWAVIFDPKYLEKIKGASPCSTARTSSSPPRSSTWATRPTIPTRSTGRRPPISSRKRSRTGPRSTPRPTSRSSPSATSGSCTATRNDIFQANLDAQKAKRKFRILQGMPKEGAVLAVDSMVVHKTAPRPDLAAKFINFMLDGKNSAELTNLIGSGNPNADASEVHQAGAQGLSRDLSAEGGPGEARAAAGFDAGTTPTAQQDVDRS